MSIFLNMIVHSAAVEAAQGKTTAQNAEMMAQELRRQVNKLTLINMALFEILHEKLGLTEAELQAKMTEIDLRDGHLGGDVPHTPPVSCEACGKTYSKRHNHCLYCGHINMSGSPF